MKFALFDYQIVTFVFCCYYCSIGSIITGSFIDDLGNVNDIPVIDISLCDSKEEDHLICCYAIDTALRQFGTFIAINHAIPLSIEKQSFDSAKELFSLDILNKVNVSLNQENFGRGYIPFGKEAGVSSYLEVKEGYSYGMKRSVRNFKKRNPMESLNIWPSNLSNFAIQQLENQFVEQVRVLKVVISALLAVWKDNGDIHSGFYNAMLQCIENNSDGDSISLMRLFHYFPSDFSDLSPDSYKSISSSTDSQLEFTTTTENIENNLDTNTYINATNISKETTEKKSSIGSSPHTDWGLLTVILHDGVGGLQFYHNQEWKDIPIVEGGLVVNGGDYLHMLSKGRYHSPIHR